MWIAWFGESQMETEKGSRAAPSHLVPHSISSLRFLAALAMIAAAVLAQAVVAQEVQQNPSSSNTAPAGPTQTQSATAISEHEVESQAGQAAPGCSDPAISPWRRLRREIPAQHAISRQSSRRLRAREGYLDVEYGSGRGILRCPRSSWSDTF